jgi:hypothetical protein
MGDYFLVEMPEYPIEMDCKYFFLHEIDVPMRHGPLRIESCSNPQLCEDNQLIEGISVKGFHLHVARGVHCVDCKYYASKNEH